MNTDKGINQLISEFLSEKDCKPNTLDLYKRTLKIWVKWMVQNADIKNPTIRNIIAYKNYLKDTKRITTVDSYIISVKLLFKWMLHKQIIDQDITLGIQCTTKYKGHRRGSLKQDQVIELLSRMPKETMKEKRNYAIVNLMVRTGLRCTEVVSLNVKDLVISANHYSLCIQRKGHNEKDCTISITASTALPMIQYLKARGYVDESDPLFICCSTRSKVVRSIDNQAVGNVVRKALLLIGIDDPRITAHSLRHTAAMCAIKGGATVYEVQQMLGHRSPDTTMIYIAELERENMEAATAIKILDNVYRTA